MSNKVNLGDKLSSFGELWSPKVIGELNGQFVKLVKCQGEYPWHSHAEEDELFMVLHGQLEIRLRDKSVTLDEGEFFIVPRGVEHSPAAQHETHVLLFEPASTRNTGNVNHEYTIEAKSLEHI